MSQGSNNGGGSVINISKKNTKQEMEINMPNLTNKANRNNAVVQMDSMSQPTNWTQNNQTNQRVGSINSNPGSTVSRGSKFNNVAS